MPLQTEVVVTRVGVPVTRWRCWADSRQSDYEPINFCLEKYYKIFFCNIYRVDLLVLGDRSPRGGYRHPGRIRILPEHSQVGLFNSSRKGDGSYLQVTNKRSKLADLQNNLIITNSTNHPSLHTKKEYLSEKTLTLYLIPSLKDATSASKV